MPEKRIEDTAIEKGLSDDWEPRSFTRTNS